MNRTIIVAGAAGALLLGSVAIAQTTGSTSSGNMSASQPGATSTDTGATGATGATTGSTGATGSTADTGATGATSADAYSTDTAGTDMAGERG